MQTKLLIYIVIGVLVVAGIAGASLYFTTKQPAPVTEEAEVRSVIEEFYKAVEAKDGNRTLNFFTSPQTQEEKDEYAFFVGQDLPQPSPRVFWRVDITNPEIIEISVENNRVRVTAQDSFSSYNNVTATWSDPVSRDITLELVKRNGKWLIEHYKVEGYTEKYPEKYSGFRMMPAQASPSIVDETAGWKIYRNEEYGFEVKYPENFFWREPKAIPLSCDYASFFEDCPYINREGLIVNKEGQEEAIRQGFVKKMEKVTINNIPYCFQELAEGAAGSTYVTYYYVTTKNKECFAVSLVIRHTNCGVYGSPEEEAYKKCEYENNITKPGVLNQAISTFRFVK